jgi:hypothetical protein
MFACDCETLELMQRAYNAAVLDVCGPDAKPEESICDAIAKAILFMTSTGQRDLAKLTYSSASKARLMLEEQQTVCGSYRAPRGSSHAGVSDDERLLR